MTMRDYDLVIVGGGPAGMAAAVAAVNAGVDKDRTLIIERGDHLGGILRGEFYHIFINTNFHKVSPFLKNGAEDFPLPQHCDLCAHDL